MTYFEDTGAVIDAPIERVWEYLVSEHHGYAHSRNARNFRVKETVGSTATVSAERFLDGRWSTFISKSTDLPPFCICSEEIEGDFAGTRFVLLYRPQVGRRGSMCTGTSSRRSMTSTARGSSSWDSWRGRRRTTPPP